MSADNGIFILISPSAKNPEEKEYRVAEGSDSSMSWYLTLNHENEESKPIFSNTSIPRKKEDEFLLHFFRESSVYPSLEAAETRAEEIEDEFDREGWPIEYGRMEILLDRPFPIV